MGEIEIVNHKADTCPHKGKVDSRGNPMCPDVDSIGWKFWYKGKLYGNFIVKKDESLTEEKVRAIGERERLKIIEVIESEKRYG